MQEQRKRDVRQEHKHDHDQVGVRRSGLKHHTNNDCPQDACQGYSKAVNSRNRATLILRDLIGNRGGDGRKGNVGEELDATPTHEQEDKRTGSPHDE